jgi:uncharacterized phage-associated protein
MVARTNKLKNLNIEPLSVAKYFYEKGIEDMALSQRLIYLSYLEVLKDGCLLFAEEWQAWPHGPAVKSTFDKMYDSRHHLAKLFKPVKDISDKKVLNQLENTYQKYKNTEPYIIFEKAQNRPWKEARKPLKSEREITNIELANLIKFTNGNGNRARVN